MIILVNAIRPLLHITAVLALLVSTVQAAQTNGLNDMKDKEQAVAAVQAKHDTEIIAIEGVVSVGIGLTKDGEPCLKVGTSGSTEGIREKLPDATKDICVEIEKVGDIEAQ
jgi:hypothetical protein